MISWKAEGQVNYKSGFCLSTDEKPTTGVANGSCLIEMDTGTEYRYDAEGGEWYAQGSGGGGGNPNRVQTVTGTLDDPWGDVDVNELSEAIASGNATAILEADGTALGFGTITQSVTAGTTNLYSTGAGIDASTSSVTANVATWSNTIGNITQFDIYVGGTFTDALAYASLVPTALTIIWHPLPEN